MTTPTPDPNAAHRTVMRQSLDHAAAVLGVEIADGVAWGWRERSIGAHVTNDRGDWWLRVVRELTAWTGGDFWRGNAEATAITGVPKPAVTWIEEWDDGDVQFRAELMTLIRANRCAATEPLRDTITLSDTWWSTLRHSVDRVANWRTGRTCLDQETVTRRLLAFCGPAVDATVTAWTTAHGDLHWANITEPQFYILDWEGWGLAPAGYDAAILYCHSLLVPAVARRVHATFADILDSEPGRLAQLYTITRLLLRIEDGDYPDLAGPLHEHLVDLLPSSRETGGGGN